MVVHKSAEPNTLVVRMGFDQRDGLVEGTPRRTILRASFKGLFSYPESGIPPLPAEILTWSGTAMLQFDWSVSNDFWTFRGANYEFSPVPEPTSIALVGVGLAGIFVRRWWERKT